MKINREWKDFEILATGDGEKLERWGDTVLLRPDPQVIWRADKPLTQIRRPDARYIRSQTGGGRWEASKPLGEWVVGWRELKFKVKPMGFKHTGLFPEQAYNWDVMTGLVASRGGRPTVLNLFGYTGGASVALAAAGAKVTHVDAAKNMVERCGKNARLSSCPADGIRYIVDDCAKFVAREKRRGNRYDAILMDPPSYGRGPGGEMWRLEDNICALVSDAAGLLSDEPLFFLINSYTTGLQPTVLDNIMKVYLPGGKTSAYELTLPTKDREIKLPCGCTGLWRTEG